MVARPEPEPRRFGEGTNVQPPGPGAYDAVPGIELAYGGTVADSGERTAASLPFTAALPLRHCLSLRLHGQDCFSPCLSQEGRHFAVYLFAHTKHSQKAGPFSVARLKMDLPFHNRLAYSRVDRRSASPPPLTAFACSLIAREIESFIATQEHFGTGTVPGGLLVPCSRSRGSRC